MKNSQFFYKSYLLVLVFGLLFTTKTEATHYLGSEITYTCLGSNQYKVQLTNYTDCSGIGNPSAMNVNFASAICSNNFNASLPLLSGYPVEITPDCSTVTSTCAGGTSLGIHKFIYESIVTLPATCSDWVVSYNSCCRNGAAMNLMNSFSSSHYISTNIDNTLSNCNNSPSFNETTYPIRYGCVSDTNYLDFSSMDTDGDSLVYSLVDVLQGAGSSVIYSSGFSGQSPFSGSVSINSSTGLVTVIPTTAQSGYMAVKVEEYRNGVKIGEVTREVMMYFQNCSSNTLPKVVSVNGTSVTGASFSYTIAANNPFTLNIGTYDVEVAAGTQTLTSTWTSNITSATPVGGSTASPSFSWTPTNADVGTHLVTLRLEDDACSMLGMNTFDFYITVQGGPITNNAPVAADDYASTTLSQPVVIDILQNDSDPDGNNLTVVNIITPATNGIALVNFNNSLTYTPISTGTDSLVYEVCDDGTPSLCDQAVVYINVDYDEYYVTNTVAAGVVTDLCFDMTGLSGSLVSATPQTNDFVHATIQNIDLSTGCVTIHADSVATDSMTFLICDANGDCIINHLVLNIDIGVWPGDTDTSQLVNHFDLLNIGFAYGNTGTPRNPASITWNGYLTPDWTKVMPVSNINFKHIDCNGDGIIDAQDTTAIAANWSQSYTYNKSGGGTIPLYVDTVPPSSYKASLPIMLGTSTIPANDVYGIAFTIVYDTALVEPNTLDISIDTSWLGTAGTDLISIHKDFYNDGIVQVAITRTDGTDQDGFGRIADIRFTIQDDIMLRGSPKFIFDVEGVKVIDEMENPVLVSPQSSEITIIQTNTQTHHLNHLVKVFPNPTSDVLNIQCNDLNIEQVILTDMTGKTIHVEMVNQSQVELYMQNIPEGIYTLTIQTNKGRIHQKISVLK